MINTRQWLVSLAVLACSVAPAQAQVSARTCSSQDQVGYLGINGIDCNCTIASPGSGKEWSFRTEPRITSLEMDSRAGAVLKIGDVITHVNGRLITTRDGARALAEVDPGEAVVLTVRRNGQSLKYALTAEAACPTDTRLLGIYAPGVVQGKAPIAYATVPASRARAATPPSARATFGMGLACSGNCSIKVSEKNNVHVMSFSEPPEVYSIERGGAADRAGMRRGDVITHINGKAMDSDEGGALFASTKPGETVRFTVQRGSERRTFSVRAASRAPMAPGLAQSSESLDRARQSLTQLQRDQEQQLRKIQEELRRSQQMEQQKLQEVHREMLRAEREHKEKLAEIARELSRADGRMRAALADSARAVCSVPMTTPLPGTNRTLRYTGTIGNSEIEVRGANPVSVTESKDEVTITAGGTIVKVKKSK